MRPLRNIITFANVTATIALVLSMSGSAYAAKKLIITGANVKNGSLTGADIKNASLTSSDLNASVTTSLRGKNGTNGTNGKDGAKGDRGPRGAEGPAGPKGDVGPPGEAAAVVTSYASRDTGILKSSTAGVPNPGQQAWYDYNCADGSPAPCANDDGNFRNDAIGNITLIADPQMVLALQGMSRFPEETHHEINTRNNIVVPWKTNLTGMATVSLLHEGTTKYANAATPSEFRDLGEPQMVTAYGTKEIATLTLVGSENLNPGTYNVRVWCADMDYASQAEHGWRFIRGNLTAFAARNDS